MTKETSHDSHAADGAGAGAGAGGGPKKFLYTGPKHKSSIFAAESHATSPPSLSNQSLRDRIQENSALHNGSWKDVSVPLSTNNKPSTQEGWSKGVDKSFYSRYGGINAGAMGESGSRTWAGTSSSSSTSRGPSSQYPGAAAAAAARKGSSIDPLGEPPSPADQLNSRYSLPNDAANNAAANNNNNNCTPS